MICLVLLSLVLLVCLLPDNTEDSNNNPDGGQLDGQEDIPRNIPKDLQDISEKVPQHVLDHPECLLELLTSAEVENIDSASILKLMNYYDKSVGSEAYRVRHGKHYLRNRI